MEFWYARDKGKVLSTFTFKCLSSQKPNVRQSRFAIMMFADFAFLLPVAIWAIYLSHTNFIHEFIGINLPKQKDEGIWGWFGLANSFFS